MAQRKNIDVFQLPFIRMFDDWDCSIRFFVEDLSDFISDVEKASTLRKPDARKTAFKHLALVSHQFHLAMVAIKAIRPQYPCSPDVFAPLMRLFLQTSETGVIPDELRVICDGIYVQKEALSFVSFDFEIDKSQTEKILVRKNISPRRNADRDKMWLDWSIEGMTPAKIRDKWNSENPDRKVDISKSDNGTDTVKKAIIREKIRREVSAGQDSGVHPGLSPIVPD